MSRIIMTERRYSIQNIFLLIYRYEYVAIVNDFNYFFGYVFIDKE